MAPSAIDDSLTRREVGKALPAPTLYPVQEAKFERYIPPQIDGHERALQQPQGAAAIVIDNGSSTVRAGWSFEKDPRLQIPPIMAKYRDRKLGKTYSFAGRDCYADTAARSHIRNAFEAGTGIVSNWDVMEHVLDYVFLKLGLNGVDGAVDMPILMTEAVANLPYSRKTMTEIIFECYGAPGLAYGIDSLFSYNYNHGKTGLVVSSSYSATHVIPVYDSKAILSQSIRLNWGGWHAAEFLLKLMRLKYHSGFPGKLSLSQAEWMVREFCYVSQDYDQELAHYLDWTGLEDRDRIIQYPYTEEVVVQKTEEELARIAERKRESGRRLQEQAAKLRLERLMKKEKELEYYKDVQRRILDQTKKEAKRLLDEAEVKDEAQLEKMVRELERSIKRARTKDLGGEQEEEHEAPSFDLLDVPDDQLDEAGLKQKKHQRLLKSNHDARARAKAEKEAEKARIAEEARLDEERRTNDLEGWLEEKRQARLAKLVLIKERDRLKADLGNRKSLASQIRMKNIANLASDNPTGGGRKRRRGGDDDDFGADDADWGVYRSVAMGANRGDSDDDEDGEEDLEAAVRALEEDLLRYDQDFTYEHTLEAQKDWTKSLLHAFRHGPRPHDPASAAETHQLHLNVERIRVPEAVFQPGAIAGVDQAGLVEMAGDVLTQRLAGAGADRDAFLRDVFLTGGNTLFRGFDARLRDALTALLPAGSPLAVRRAGDARLDAWRGAARWAGSGDWRDAVVSREEYLEKGSEYLKEHNFGNAFS